MQRTVRIRGGRALLACLLPALLSVPAAGATSAGAAPSTAPPPSLRERAVAYEHGEGVPKDSQAAALLYCEAARSGDADAAYGLGWMYANGRGVARDDAAAAALFALAAQAGHEQARNLLAAIGGEPGALPDCMQSPAPEEPAADPSATEPVPPPDPFADLPPWKQRIADQVERYAPRYAVEPRLALAVIAAESNFDHLAVSPKGAQGLMQLIPETATRFNVSAPFDMRENLRGGLAYLRWLLAYYRGNVELAVAAYNAGERAVDKYGGVPPFAETREYVRRIMAVFPSARHAFDARITGPSPMLSRGGPDRR
jgi:soluble lytic murein transglycosylase-like protein